VSESSKHSADADEESFHSLDATESLADTSGMDTSLPAADTQEEQQHKQEENILLHKVSNISDRFFRIINNSKIVCRIHIWNLC
jgi:hypothetical protein